MAEQLISPRFGTPTQSDIQHAGKTTTSRKQNSEKLHYFSGFHQDATIQPKLTNQGSLDKPDKSEAKGGLFAKIKQHLSTSPASYYMKATLATSRENKDEILSMETDAQLANYVYHRAPDQLPKGYILNDRFALQVREALKLDAHNVVKNEGTVIDPKSGLTACIFGNLDKKEIVISFGGTTSGKKVGEDLMKRSRPGMNFMTTLSQWGANFYAGLGGVPKSYKQAAAVAKNVQKMMQEPEFKGYTLRIVGHSKGGGEAMYASMMQENPLKVTAFCPAHLSQGLIDKIPQKNLEKATELINSYSPEGDPVSALRGKLPGLPGIGNGHHFKGIENSSAVELHDQFCKQVVRFRFDTLGPIQKSDPDNLPSG